MHAGTQTDTAINVDAAMHQFRNARGKVMENRFCLWRLSATVTLERWPWNYYFPQTPHHPLLNFLLKGLP
jgi:hypothetical protein